VYRDLVIFAEALGQGTGKATVEPAKVVPPMLARFMAADRAFEASPGTVKAVCVIVFRHA
jgi:hypothetical protein